MFPYRSLFNGGGDLTLNRISDDLYMWLYRTVIEPYFVTPYWCRGAFKGGQGGLCPPRRVLTPLGSKFHIFFLQSYYEMIKGIQHVHVL